MEVDPYGHVLPKNPGARYIYLPDGTIFPIRNFLKLAGGFTIYDDPVSNTTNVTFEGSPMATEVTIIQLPQGQQAAAASAPVVLASDQTLPLPTGAATQTTLAAVSGKLPSALGATTSSGSMSVVLASDQATVPVSAAPSASVGASTTHHAIMAATTNATSVKASAGTINTLIICNNATSKRYFKLYNKASAPTVGTDTPIITYMVPPGETHELPTGAYGLRLTTGIAYAVTTGIAVSDATAVALNDLSVHIGYT